MAAAWASFSYPQAWDFCRRSHETVLQTESYCLIRRQLNLYGFIRLLRGSDKGAYYNESFLRGRPLLSLGIMKNRMKGNKTPRSVSSLTEDEPQFYQIPFWVLWISLPVVRERTTILCGRSRRWWCQQQHWHAGIVMLIIVLLVLVLVPIQFRGRIHIWWEVEEEKIV